MAEGTSIWFPVLSLSSILKTNLLNFHLNFFPIPRRAQDSEVSVMTCEKSYSSSRLLVFELILHIQSLLYLTGTECGIELGWQETEGKE